MVWKVTFHREIQYDMRELGRVEAQNLLTVIEARIINGEPDKTGKPLHGALAGYRRLRTGTTRIVYRVEKQRIEILIIAVGMRRDGEIYEKANKRVE